LHPRIAQELDLAEVPVVFEIAAAAACAARLPAPTPLSEFPSSRRDIALVLREEISANRLLAAVRQTGARNLRSVQLFDVYRGPGLPDGCKSIALGLIFQDYSRTLNDEEVDAAVGDIAASVSAQLGASFRG
jgi:phenylalanyl-tRNA synthetase beta chain